MTRTATTEYDKLYTLLVHLCEQQTLAEDAVLYVMEAFNGLAELHTPDRLLSPRETGALDRLERVIELLDRLIAASRDLGRTLALLRLRGLVDAAMDVQR